MPMIKHYQIGELDAVKIPFSPPFTIFHIFTIKPAGKEAYDIVSNGEKWQACTTEGKLDVPIGENAVVANGFRCYKEGERWIANK